ncbi:hypothetical protein Cycma_2771 [Cyclobacterium marinum DSM 745]|uniref:Secreted protein n=1 Tax=Cyclobacterium marinum (strain ATCC 25205 / DSM 745 / LMG 13164 / NCIMB 1802) TaxID=880070 RepID=G0J008_CYCMS|nr:hypothetical protein Cycma_2771 [Cyclobacterium marinum DSM 745]
MIASFFLFANIGLAKSSHICMGSEMLNNFGLSAKHLECDMDSQEHLPSSQNQQEESKDQCCQNQFELIQLETDQTLKVSELSAPQIVFVAAFTQVFLLAEELVFIAVSTNSFDPPPIPSEDYTVLYQTFLI